MKGKDFKPLQEEKDGGTPSGKGSFQGRNFASELWGEVRGGAEHFQSTKGQLPKGRIRQFFYGVALPFHIARVTLASPAVRATYVKVTALQTAFLLAIAAGWAFHEFTGDTREETQERREETPKVRAAREKAQARIDQRARELEAAKGDPTAMKNALAALIHEAVNAGKSGDLPPEEAATAAEDAADEAAAATEEAKAEHEEAEQEARAAAPRAGSAQDTEDTATPEADADAEDSLGDQLSAAIRAEVEAALRDVPEANAKGPRIQKEPQKKGFNIDAPTVRNGTFFLGSWEFWALFFGSLSAVQWIVVALSRDYHTVISREASLATGVPPEDPDITPHVRLNVPWLRAKLQRRWRAFLLFVMGVPALVLLCIPLCWFPKSFTVLSSLWGFWWLLVFTAAKSDRAWMAPVTRPPWFVRVWSRLPTHGSFRWVMSGLARRSESVAAPIAAVERQPWVFAGLALTRFVGSLPPLRCFTRPFIPVASAHLLGLDPVQPPALKSGEAPPPHGAGD
ncbi:MULTISPECIES: hypothetical protein [unclassified Corallococcus]|uniref:hypothetical protein n=1 Tax=unclassified Corallococcus TaxID=2685029 RepID=UPI001A8E15EA|nr:MULTISPECIES: hypothetical protein [unclassified Corallococcus]MBN9683791.1 hypothetical protein [Corallococcus sp. NCSPR001]WAS84708.1 hypothetical protein O0N60_36240 [Corallococcus sp. NCRR]